jgi:hypothetical protein
VVRTNCIIQLRVNVTHFGGLVVGCCYEVLAVGGKVHRSHSPGMSLQSDRRSLTTSKRTKNVV